MEKTVTLVTWWLGELVEKLQPIKEAINVLLCYYDQGVTAVSSLLSLSGSSAMPTVQDSKLNLSSGGHAVAPQVDRKTKLVRDARPTLKDHNEAEWEGTMAFLQQEHRKTGMVETTLCYDLFSLWNSCQLCHLLSFNFLERNYDIIGVRLVSILYVGKSLRFCGVLWHCNCSGISERLKQESQTPDLTGSWCTLHDKARDNDGEGLVDCVDGRKGAILKVSSQCLTIIWCQINFASMVSWLSPPSVVCCSYFRLRDITWWVCSFTHEWVMLHATYESFRYADGRRRVRGRLDIAARRRSFCPVDPSLYGKEPSIHNVLHVIGVSVTCVLHVCRHTDTQTHRQTHIHTYTLLSRDTINRLQHDAFTCNMIHRNTWHDSLVKRLDSYMM